MKKPTAPCKWCKNHEAGCHGKCEEYKEFEEKHQEWKKHFGDGRDEFDKYKSNFRKKQR